MKPLQVTVVGAGMIVHDQLLPSLYQLRRLGWIGDITVCGRTSKGVRQLKESAILRQAFPDQDFRAVPDPRELADQPQPARYREVLEAMPPRNLVVVAVPDPLHREVVEWALTRNQHVICVKPFVLRVEDSLELEREARSRGLFIGIDYHKRFDTRNLMARRRYRDGLFGEFRLGQAWLFERWAYRRSNFQTWFTKDATDAFTYVGCHYVDLVAFITGLRPVAVSVYALADRFPNGVEGYLWTDARVIWENGACLNVQNGFAVPDVAPGANAQGLVLYCSTGQRAGRLEHQDQFRGVAHAYVEPVPEYGEPLYRQPNPDFFEYLPYEGPGLQPSGYGYRSIEALVQAVRLVESVSEGDRLQQLQKIDRDGLLATPANSRYNELVTEAARHSIKRGGELVWIEYEPEPRVLARS